jgi:hypothetical protein
MPPTVRATSRTPRDPKVSEGGCFYAADAVRLAGITGLNYRQLRQLFRLVKGEDAEPGRWLQFNIRDIVALKIAYSLARGKKTKHKHVRLHVAQVEAAIANLRRHYRIADPLTQVRLKWDGATIVAALEGVHFEAMTGQLLLHSYGVNSRAAKVTWLVASERRSLRGQLREELAVSKAFKTPLRCVTPKMKATARLGQ